MARYQEQELPVSASTSFRRKPESRRVVAVGLSGLLHLVWIPAPYRGTGHAFAGMTVSGIGRGLGRRSVVVNGAGLLCLLLLPALLLAGCGRKGAPRAPELLAPAAITDLTARAGESGVRLGWSRPQVALDGRKLTDLAAFVVLRKSTRADCADCRTAYRERAVINVEDEGRFFKRSEYDYTDRDLRAGTVYRYRVLARLSDGSSSGPSNEVSIEWKK